MLLQWFAVVTVCFDFQFCFIFLPINSLFIIVFFLLFWHVAMIRYFIRFVALLFSSVKHVKRLKVSQKSFNKKTEKKFQTSGRIHSIDIYCRFCFLWSLEREMFQLVCTHTRTNSLIIQMLLSVYGYLLLLLTWNRTTDY